MAPKPAQARKVGLLGGSFNPAHEGHRHISLLALKRLELDAVWWLISPGNPLKDHSELAGLQTRIATARAVMKNHPRLCVSTFEIKHGLTYTAQTLARLVPRHRDIRFVWLMGGDNLATIHHWRDWPDIFRLVRVAVIDRPGTRYRALASVAATRFTSCRIDEAEAHRLAELEPPAWVYLCGPTSPLSSTALRKAARDH